MNVTTNVNNIEKMIRDNHVYRFTTELENTYDSERKILIEKILNKLKGEKNKEPINNKLNDYFDKITNNCYKKQWSKLQDFHKKEKIIEYIQNQQISEKEKNKLKKTLIFKLENSDLPTKYVDYDSKECKINLIKL